MVTSPHIPCEIEYDIAELERFCIEEKILKLSLFGSVLREDFLPTSDIDILVEFLPGENVTYIRLSRMERSLSRIFGSRTIDLRMRGELSDCFRDRVIAEAEPIYVFR